MHLQGGGLGLYSTGLHYEHLLTAVSRRHFLEGVVRVGALDPQDAGT